jgi:hypothetical protein
MPPTKQKTDLVYFYISLETKNCQNITFISKELTIHFTIMNMKTEET